MATDVFTTEVQNTTESYNEYDVGLEVATAELRRLNPTETWGYKLGTRINTAWMPVVLLLGWIGNTMSLAVFSRRKNRATSCCVYMWGLAVSDSCVMGVGTYYYLRTVYVTYFKSKHVTSYYPQAWECVLFTWLLNFVSLSGVCIVISMTVDRFIGVRFPLLAKRLCKPTKAKRVLIVIPILAGSYTIPYLLYSKAVGNMCISLSVRSTFTTVYSWVTISLNSFIPFVCLLSLNAAIIIAVRKSKAQKGKIQSTMTTKRENQLVVLLLMISFIFLVLTMPQYARYLAFQYIDQYASEQSLSDFFVYMHVTNKMFYTNSAVNFLLYCIGGSKFRKDLRKLCFCGKKSSKKNSTNIYSIESATV